MAKKAVKKVAPKAPIKKSKRTPKEEAQALRNVLDGKVNEPPVVEQTPVIETPVVEQPVVEIPTVETTPVVETPVVETTPVVESTTTPVDEIKEEPLSIWSSNSSTTEEDSGAASQTLDDSTLGNLADAASKDENLADDEAARRTACRVKADIMVELADCGFMVLCLLLTWDFSEGNQTRFTLAKDRKKAIAVNLTKIYLLDKKKPEPKKDIIFLIIGSYIPMLLIAVMSLIRRLRQKQEEKKEKLRLAQIQQQYAPQMVVVQQPVNPEMQNVINRVQNNSVEMMREENLQVVKRPTVKRTATKNATVTRGVKPGTKRGPYRKSA